MATDQETPPMSWPVVIKAAVSGGTFAIPLAVAQQWLIDSGRVSKGDPFNYAIVLLILLSGCLCGFAAGKLTSSRPLQHGALAAAVMYCIIQAAGTIRRLISGEPLSNPVAWAFLALLLATCGMFGAAIERRTKPLREDTPTTSRTNSATDNGSAASSPE
ncbi:MAG TPA: hypothetical protein DEG43_14085 [Acidimicrobiaceae bacterium]|jgi:hypothetical protein|nr:hypothetical protein [Acidimicrobiaceae bacterium]